MLRGDLALSKRLGQLGNLTRPSNSLGDPVCGAGGERPASRNATLKPSPPSSSASISVAHRVCNAFIVSTTRLAPATRPSISPQTQYPLISEEPVKSGIGMSCRDLAALSAGLPLFDLLGGRSDGVIRLHSSIPSGTTAHIKDEVAIARDQGYTFHSVKIGPIPSVTSCPCGASTGRWLQVRG